MEYSTKPSDKNKRLDLLVSQLKLGLTRSQAQRLIDCGKITVNKKESKHGYRIKIGDIISIDIPEPQKIESMPENIPLNIIYEDKDIIVINKPRGFVVHPAPGNYTSTLVNALLYHIKDLSGIGGKLRPGIVHRLDKDTSGVIVVAKNDKAHNSLARQFKDRTIEKTYVAIVKGRMKSDVGIISENIGRHPVNRKKMSVVAGCGLRVGREAITRYKVLKRFDGYTLVELKPKTGRTHQLRVHLSHIGHPIVGDLTYGGKNDLGVTKQLLHARELVLIHPVTGKSLKFEASMPDDMLSTIDKFGKATKA